jgi:BirA family transcriptional regulator, biotin operon repressor / biotin---[acetyl-CoA-carboxylase] ligase
MVMIASDSHPRPETSGADRLRFEVVDEIDSTNRALMAEPFAAVALPPRVLLARRQTAGRGRRGRGWLTEPGRSLAFSLAIERVSDDVRAVAALPLVVGVAIVESLEGLSPDLRLKWPNDLQREARKVGGILVEARRHRAGQIDIDRFVVGIGLNLLAPRDTDGQIGQPVGGIFESEPLPLPLEALAMRVATAVEQSACQLFSGGFAAFRERWDRLDSLRGRTVVVSGPGGEPVSGRAAGIDVDGALLLETPTGLRRFVSGDVSVRSVNPAGAPVGGTPCVG